MVWRDLASYLDHAVGLEPRDHTLGDRDAVLEAQSDPALAGCLRQAPGVLVKPPSQVELQLLRCLGQDFGFSHGPIGPRERNGIKLLGLRADCGGPPNWPDDAFLVDPGLPRTVPRNPVAIRVADEVD